MKRPPRPPKGPRSPSDSQSPRKGSSKRSSAREDDDPDASATDFAVGYGRPPLHTRFKSPNSGNPKGRPKGSLNILTIAKEVFSERVSIQNGGRTKKITKIEFAMRSLLAKAVKGDVKALKEVINLSRQATPEESGGDVSDSVLDSAAFDEIVQNFFNVRRRPE